MERVMGVEPTSQPWEGRILPMNDTRIGWAYYSMAVTKKQPEMRDIFPHALRMNRRRSGKASPGGDPMKSEKKHPSVDLCLDPEQRLCPIFDSVSIRKFRVADRETMGVRVVDNCAEEHIQ